MTVELVDQLERAAYLGGLRGHLGIETASTAVRPGGLAVERLAGVLMTLARRANPPDGSQFLELLERAIQPTRSSIDERCDSLMRQVALVRGPVGHRFGRTGSGPRNSICAAHLVTTSRLGGGGRGIRCRGEVGSRDSWSRW